MLALQSFSPQNIGSVDFLAVFQNETILNTSLLQ